MANPLDQLKAELGAGALPDLSALAPGEVEDFVDAIRQARRRQKEQIGRAFDQALTHIPLLLRAPVKKILGS